LKGTGKKQADRYITLWVIGSLVGFRKTDREREREIDRKREIQRHSLRQREHRERQTALPLYNN